jgi:phosphopantetheine--protein transferase-like protein
MIIGIGTDIIATERFLPWTKFSKKKLERIFTKYELEYCFSSESLCSQRLAVRFAAREAFFKAISQATDHQIPFLTLTRATQVTKNPAGAPCLKIEWDIIAAFLPHPLPNIAAHLSLSHTDKHALAFVVLEK